MEKLNEKQKRELVVQFYQINKDHGKKNTVDHFLKMGMKKSSLYQIIKRFEKTNTTDRKKVLVDHPGSLQKGPKLGCC